MIETIQIAVLLLVVVAAVALAARRLGVPPAILLVVVGVVLALVPGLPRVELVPELVLLLVLPPLIYSAGVAMSWREFRFNLRPITLLGGRLRRLHHRWRWPRVGHALLGLPWPVGFVLGAIISPPDVVAPLAIARRLGLPRRLLVILEGEGLANDATALILYRFAVAAVSTGTFSLGPALGTFAAIIIGEIAYGVAVGWLMLRLRHAARDPRVEITLSLVTPYLAFWVPEHLGGSGVLATVATGLYISWNGPLLITSATRLQGVFFWDLVHLSHRRHGLPAHRTAGANPDRPHRRSARQRAAGLGRGHQRGRDRRPLRVGVSGHLSAALARSRDRPQGSFASLAGAVPARRSPGSAGSCRSQPRSAIPFATANGEPFPHRDLILFLTFCVIVVTLVGQGLLLPSVIRWLGLTDMGRAERRLEEARRAGEPAADDRGRDATPRSSSRPSGTCPCRSWSRCAPTTASGCSSSTTGSEPTSQSNSSPGCPTSWSCGSSKRSASTSTHCCAAAS